MPGFHAFHGLRLAQEGPAELVVLFERALDLVAELELAHHGVVGAGVFVRHGHGDAFRVAVWIPEADDVEPGVERGNEGEAEDDHPGGRIDDESLEVAPQNEPYVAHDSSFASFRLGCVYFSEIRYT